MKSQPGSTCPSMVKCALGLGFLGGVVVAELFLITGAVPGFAWLDSLQLRWLVPFGPQVMVAAFLTGSVLTWPVLTGRPCLQGLRQRT